MTLQLFTIQDLPKFLQDNSVLVCQEIEEGNTTITIPSNHIVTEDELAIKISQPIGDLVKLLEKLRFYSIKRLPTSLYEYVFDRKNSIALDLHLKHFEEEYVKDLIIIGSAVQEISKYTTRDIHFLIREIIRQSICCNRRNLFDYYYGIAKSNADKDIRVSVRQYFDENGKSIIYQLSKYIYIPKSGLRCAINANNHDMIDYLIDLGFVTDDLKLKDLYYVGVKKFKKLLSTGSMAFYYNCSKVIRIRNHNNPIISILKDGNMEMYKYVVGELKNKYNLKFRTQGLPQYTYRNNVSLEWFMIFDFRLFTHKNIKIINDFLINHVTSNETKHIGYDEKATFNSECNDLWYDFNPGILKKIQEYELDKFYFNNCKKSKFVDRRKFLGYQEIFYYLLSKGHQELYTNMLFYIERNDVKCMEKMIELIIQNKSVSKLKKLFNFVINRYDHIECDQAQKITGFTSFFEIFLKYIPNQKKSLKMALTIVKNDVIDVFKIVFPFLLENLHFQEWRTIIWDIRDLNIDSRRAHFLFINDNCGSNEVLKRDIEDEL